MKKNLLILVLLFTIFTFVRGEWLPDTIINDRNYKCRMGYNVGRGLVADGNNIYAVWTDFYGYGNIYLKARTSGVWQNSELVSVESNPQGIYGTSTYPSIQTYNGHVYIVWQDYRTGDFEIIYRRFLNGWGNEINLSGNAANSKVAVIDVTDSERVFVLWQDNRTGIYEIYGKIYENNSWSTTKKLSSATFYAGFPSVTHYGETVYAVWEEMENNGYELHFSSHLGGNWSTPQKITTNEGMSQYPSICTDPSGTVHLVWMDDENGNFRIYYCKKENGSWSIPLPITDNPGYAVYPQITSDPYGIVHLVWADDREGNYDIFHKSLVSGIWGEAENISQKEGLSTSPHITCTTNGGVHVMWYDWCWDSTYTSPHIRYRRYNPTMRQFFSSVTNYATPEGIRLRADIPCSKLNLYRIESPYPVYIEPNEVVGSRYEWSQSLPPGDYTYILQAIRETEFYYSHPIEVTIPEKETHMQITTYPNPFTSFTNINLITTEKAQISEDLTLNIYDITGRLVKSFSLNTNHSPLGTVVSWDGKDEEGNQVKSGAYFIKSKAKSKNLMINNIKKIVKLR
jgi:hypothetical protein